MEVRYARDPVQIFSPIQSYKSRSDIVQQRIDWYTKANPYFFDGTGIYFRKNWRHSTHTITFFFFFTKMPGSNSFPYPARKEPGRIQIEEKRLLFKKVSRAKLCCLCPDPLILWTSFLLEIWDHINNMRRDAVQFHKAYSTPTTSHAVVVIPHQDHEVSRIHHYPRSAESGKHETIRSVRREHTTIDSTSGRSLNKADRLMLDT